MRKAFTLIEQIVVIVIIGLLALIFAVAIREGTNAWIYLSSQKNIALSTRSAINRVVKEIKRANGSLTICATSEISFTDVDNNTVDFRQVGSQLQRNTQVVLDNLQSSGGLTFQYFDKAGVATTDSAQIRLVTCRLVVTQRNNRFTLLSGVAVRSRRLK